MANEKKAGLLHASERDGVQYRKAPVWQMVIGMANNGVGVAFYLLMGFASMISGQGYGIPAALAGILLTCMRIFDGITDTLIAALFEKFNPKKGKIRIFMIFGWALCITACFMLYSWCTGKADGVAGVLLFLFCYFLFIMGYTFNGVGGGTVGIVMVNDPTQRPMMGVIGTAYSYLVPMIFTNITTFVILPKYDMQYNSAMFAEMVTWYAGITFVFLVMACIGISKVDIQETFATINKNGQKSEEKVTVKDMLAVLKENKNVQMYMLTGVSDKLAQTVAGQGVIANLLGGVLIGSYAATTMASNFSMIIGIIFAFGSGIFVAKWGAKKSTTVWSWINIAIAAGTVGFFLLLGGIDGMPSIGKMWSIPFLIYTIICIARSGANMALTTTGAAMRGDIVDYEYERSGKYMPAVVAGVYSLIDKFVSSFGITIAMLCISVVGYAGTKVPQLGDEATPGKFWMCMFLSFGLPILGWLCNVVAMKFYNLDKERMVEVQKNLAARKESAKENSEETAE